MKPREAGSRSQAAPSQAPHRRHPLRSPLDLLKRRKKLLVVSVLLTAALAAYSGYLHAVWPKCSPAGELGDVGATKAQHEAVRISASVAGSRCKGEGFIPGEQAHQRGSQPVLADSCHSRSWSPRL